MASPELKEQAKEVKQASAQLEAKPYVPAKAESEAKEDLPDVDKAYEAPMDPEKEKLPELEKENYRIAKDLSIEEKLKLGRTKEVSTAIINGAEKKIIVLKKQIDGVNPDAFVREYIDDGTIPRNLVGEQLFNRNAVFNLGLEKRLPSYEEMQAMGWSGDKHQDFLKNNFQKDGKNLFPGCWDPDGKTFSNVGSRADCWVADGADVALGEDADMYRSSHNPEFGFSLRLLKN